MGSTSNALDKGGKNFKKLYTIQTLLKRNKNGQTASGLYSLFIPMEWNYEGFMDTHGLPVFVGDQVQSKGIDGSQLQQELLNTGKTKFEGLKHDQDALNEYYRQFPRTEKHAFRDETKDSLFNLTRIYQQIDYNEEMNHKVGVTTGNFQWTNGIKRYSSYFLSK